MSNFTYLLFWISFKSTNGRNADFCLAPLSQVMILDTRQGVRELIIVISCKPKRLGYNLQVEVTAEAKHCDLKYFTLPRMINKKDFKFFHDLKQSFSH